MSLLAVMDRSQGSASRVRSFLVFDIIRRVFHPAEELAAPAGETVSEEHPFGMVCREAGSNISLALAFLRRVRFEGPSLSRSCTFGTKFTANAAHNWAMSPNLSTPKSPIASFSPTSTRSVSPVSPFHVQTGAWRRRGTCPAPPIWCVC